MKFLEVKPGLSINLGLVEYINKISETETEIFVQGRSFKIPVRYETFKTMLVRAANEVPAPLEQLAAFSQKWAG